MPGIDFTTALGRLLVDASLREAFALDPLAVAEKLEVRAMDRTALAQLSPIELEVQARVLIGKRLDAVRALLPETCAHLGEALWERFCAYTRVGATLHASGPLEDTHGFAKYLLRGEPGALCTAEINRVRFAFERRRLRAHLVRARARGSSRRVLQVLIRTGEDAWREWALYFVLPRLPRRRGRTERDKAREQISDKRDASTLDSSGH